MSKLEENYIINTLKGRLEESRFIHSINVMKMAVKLAKLNNYDEEKAKIAALLHDCAKNYSGAELIQYCKEHKMKIDDIKRASPGMLHADVGASIARLEFGADPDIVQAIKYHTLGHEDATLLDKIIYIADLIEEGRTLEGLEAIREIAFEDIDKGYKEALYYCIKDVEKRGKTIHPQSKKALCSAMSLCEN